DEVYEQALNVLFRLLFVAYAEDKDLLPYRSNDLYRERSLKALARQLAERQAGDLCAAILSPDGGPTASADRLIAGDDAEAATEADDEQRSADRLEPRFGEADGEDHEQRRERAHEKQELDDEVARRWRDRPSCLHNRIVGGRTCRRPSSPRS